MQFKLTESFATFRSFISGAAEVRVSIGEEIVAQNTSSVSVFNRPKDLNLKKRFKSLTAYIRGGNPRPIWFKWPFYQTSLDPSCSREAYLGLSPLSQLIWAKQSPIVSLLFEELYDASRVLNSSLKPAHLDYLLVIMGNKKLLEWSQLYPKHEVKDVERILFKVCQAIIERRLKVTGRDAYNFLG